MRGNGLFHLPDSKLNQENDIIIPLHPGCPVYGLGPVVANQNLNVLYITATPSDRDQIRNDSNRSTQHAMGNDPFRLESLKTNIVAQFVMSSEQQTQATNNWISLSNAFNCNCQHIWIAASNELFFQLFDADMNPISGFNSTWAYQLSMCVVDEPCSGDNDESIQRRQAIANSFEYHSRSKKNPSSPRTPRSPTHTHNSKRDNDSTDENDRQSNTEKERRDSGSEQEIKVEETDEIQAPFTQLK